MDQKTTKQLLVESYDFTKKTTGVDPSKPGAIRSILGSDQNFDIYAKSLAEGLDNNTKKDFIMLAENTRRGLLENSMYGINPYESLALPLLRVFFPKTIAKELVTVIPMDKPEIVRGFIRASFKRFGDAQTYNAPSNTDVSRGPAINVPLTNAASVIGGAPIDILAIAGLTPDLAHVEKDFEITGVTFNDSSTADVSIKLTVDGNFSAAVDSGSMTDTITGRLNLENGILEVASVANSVTRVAFKCNLSLEENTINTKAKFSIDKMRLIAKDRTISTEWSVQMEQDVKALFNVDIQSDLVSVIGQQIVLDIDKEIVSSLIYASESLNSASHSKTFSKTAPASFTWGPKQWMENVIVPLNEISASIYSDTNIAAANVIACHPLDAAVFESINGFVYTGTASTDGDLGYASATVAGGKWKILVSNVVPQGKSVVAYKPVESLKATYIFSPYMPAILTPFPLGNTPSLSVLSRYGTQLIRPQGLGVLNFA